MRLCIRKIRKLAQAVCLCLCVMLHTSCAEEGLWMALELLSLIDLSAMQDEAPPKNTSVQKNFLQTPAPVSLETFSHGELAKEVDRQISEIWKECKKKGIRDYDRNGVINCCDAATAACTEWMNTYSRKVRLCQQQTNSLNHMYLQIWMGDNWGWWSVDPRYTADGTHDMETVWRGRYSKRHDDPHGYWVDYFYRYI